MEEQSLKTSLVSSPLLHWNWLRIAKLTSQFALGVVLLWWIVDWLSVDGRRLAQVFVDASFIYLSWAVICFTLSMFLKMLQYSLLLPARVSSKYIFGLILSQHALLTFLPWRLGEISVPVWLRQDQKIPLANSVPSIIAIRSVDLLIVVVVAMAAISKIDFDVSVVRVVYGLGIAAVLVCVGGFSARWFRGQTLLKEVAIAIKPIINPFRLGKLILLSAAIFILSTLQSLAALHAFGFAISICDVALLNALTVLAALLPIHPPGGWGTIDSIQIVILNLLNYRPERVATVILAAHCFYTLLVLLGGSIGWIIRERSLRQ